MEKINGRTNKTFPEVDFERHKKVAEALEVAKKANFGQDGGQKYKIVDFEVNLIFGAS